MTLCACGCKKKIIRSIKHPFDRHFYNNEHYYKWWNKNKRPDYEKKRCARKKTLTIKPKIKARFQISNTLKKAYKEINSLLGEDKYYG